MERLNFRNSAGQRHQPNPIPNIYKWLAQSSKMLDQLFVDDVKLYQIIKSDAK